MLPGGFKLAAVLNYQNCNLHELSSASVPKEDRNSANRRRNRSVRIQKNGNNGNQKRVLSQDQTVSRFYNVTLKITFLVLEEF